MNWIPKENIDKSIENGISFIDNLEISLGDDLDKLGKSIKELFSDINENWQNSNFEWQKVLNNLKIFFKGLLGFNDNLIDELELSEAKKLFEWLRVLKESEEWYNWDGNEEWNLYVSLLNKDKNFKFNSTEIDFSKLKFNDIKEYLFELSEIEYRKEEEIFEEILKITDEKILLEKEITEEIPDILSNLKTEVVDNNKGQNEQKENETENNSNQEEDYSELYKDIENWTVSKTALEQYNPKFLKADYSWLIELKWWNFIQRTMANVAIWFLTLIWKIPKDYNVDKLVESMNGKLDSTQQQILAKIVKKYWESKTVFSEEDQSCIKNIRETLSIWNTSELWKALNKFNYTAYKESLANSDIPNWISGYKIPQQIISAFQKDYNKKNPNNKKTYISVLWPVAAKIMSGEWLWIWDAISWSFSESINWIVPGLWEMINWDPEQTENNNEPKQDSQNVEINASLIESDKDLIMDWWLWTQLCDIKKNNIPIENEDKLIVTLTWSYLCPEANTDGKKNFSQYSNVEVNDDSNNWNTVVWWVDIKDYATDPNHETKVKGVYDDITSKEGDIKDVLTQQISQFKDSPITAEMIIAAANDYNVEPALIAAIIQMDSAYWTEWKGANTYNPWNVGNNDKNQEVTYNSWQDWVNAVAKWLSGKRTTEELYANGKITKPADLA